jgi:transcriptional regulator with XRE-family HTH domain
MILSVANAKDSLRRATVTPENLEESRKLKAIWDAKSKLTQTEFGERYDIGSQAAVGFFLNGKSALSMKAARGFARGLGVPIADFSFRLSRLAASMGEVAEKRDAQQPRTGDREIAPYSGNVTAIKSTRQEVRGALKIIEAALKRLPDKEAAQVGQLFEMIGARTPANDDILLSIETLLLGGVAEQGKESVQ